MGKCIVISAINICDGGPLTILKDTIIAFDNSANTNDKLHFLVSNPQVHSDISTKNIIFHYFPKSKKSWLARLFFEYIYFYFLSKKIRPDAWLSLHDTTPNVAAKKRYVYCHNASIFFDFPIKDIRLDPKQFLFSTFYKYLYRININKNHRVITQQTWFAEEFSRIYKLDNLLVSPPDTQSQSTKSAIFPSTKNSKKKSCFYPAFPRSFKITPIFSN